MAGAREMEEAVAKAEEREGLDVRDSSGSADMEAGDAALLLSLALALALTESPAMLGADFDVGRRGRGGERSERGASRLDEVAVSTEMCATAAAGVAGATGKGERGRELGLENSSSARFRWAGRPRGLRGCSTRGAMDG